MINPGYSDTRGETAFADLWRFEPTLQEWRRVMCTTTPMPKGGALLLADEATNMLILLGGTLPQLTGLNSHYLEFKIEF